jgi:hypothetical protein
MVILYRSFDARAALSEHGMPLRLRRRRPGLAACLATLPFGILNATAIHAQDAPRPLSWWQTECFAQQTALDDSAYVAFRRFPIDTSSIDQAARRVISFSRSGITLKTENGHVQRAWSEISQLRVDKVGAKNSALELTLATTDGVYGATPLGVVEYPCWETLRTTLGRLAPQVRIAGWSKPELPLHGDLKDLSDSVQQSQSRQR